MAIKGLQSKQLANNPSTPAPKFNFRKYSTDTTFVNNSENIDFVTYDGSLYVCTSSTPIQPTHADPIENGGFLLVVAKGEDGKQGKQGKDGADGKIPQIGARFNGGQLEIFDSTGTRLTTSPDLTGKVWKPVQEGSTLSWELSKSNSVPSDIDLEQLRPVEEKPLLLRVDSDNTKRSDEESGPANMIQWKHEGDEHWTNLISISELMNIALAGVSFWVDEQTNKWHFGHKKVISATYDSHKDGEKIISDVELGEVLFDAGALPFMNYELDFNTLLQRISDVENALNSLGSIDLSNYVLKDRLATINNQRLDTGINFNLPTDFSGLTDIQVRIYNDILQYRKAVNGTFEQQWTDVLDLSNIGEGDTSNGFVNARIEGTNLVLIRQDNTTLSIPLPSGSGTVDAYTKSEADARYQPKGNYLTEHQSLAGLVKGVRLNNGGVNGPDGQGIVDITVGDGSQPVDTSDCVKSITINNITQTPNSNNNGHLVFTIEGGTGDGLTAAQVKSLIEQTLAGLLDPLSEYNNGKVGHNYFVRFSDLSDFVTAAWIEARYYDKETINDMLDDGGTVTHETLRTFMLFQRNNTPNGGTPPSVPTNNTFVWNGESLYLTDAFANTNPSPWKNSPENVDAANGKVYLWMTLAEYSSTRGILYENNASGWSAPICLTGENGDGEDGDGIEFIYHLGASQPELNVKKAYKSGQTTKSFTTNANANAWWATKESNDWLPGDGTTSGHWTDNPTGITDDNDNTKTEWAAVRTYNGSTETWNSFSTPFIWSKWGEDGVDGDGIEYIYYVTPENGQTTYYNINPTTHKYELIDIGEIVYPPTTAQQIASIANYQTSDWYPGNTQSGTAWDRNWTDNPIGVSSDRPYEWVSVRKRVYDPLTETSSWTPFSIPSLWAKFGKDGIAKNIYTSYIFTRTDQRIGTFVLSDDIDPEDIKTYENQTAKENDQEYTFENGQHIVWSDTIPSGSGQVWISMNIINDDTYDQGWTSPTQLGDDDYFQVEYCASESIAKALPSLANGTYTGSQYPHGVNEEGLRAYMSTTYNEIWGDEDDIQEPVWMATASKRDGVWTNWAYARIKGERGEAGTSVRIKATVEYASDLSAFKPAAGNQNSASVGDCYIVIKGTLNPNTSAFGQVTAVNYTSSHIWSYGGTDNNTSDDTNVHMYGFDDLGEFANVTPNNIYMRFARLATDAEQGTTTLNIAQVPVVIGGSTVSKWLTMLSSNQSGPFIGFYIGESESSDIQDYTWSKWNGEDYYGQEQIFLKLEENLTPVHPAYNLNGVTGNRTKISGFTTHQNGSEVTINSVNETTDKANYKRFDYVPIVKVYTDNTLTRTETWVDTPEEIHDNTTTKYNCWQCTRNIGAGVYEWSNPIIYIPYVEDGTDGKDGMFEESVYARNDSTTTPPLFSKKYALKRAEGSSAASVVNATSVSGNAASGVFEVYDVLPFVFNDSNNSTPSTSTATWTDNPAGVDETAGHKVEWVSTRKITYEDPENPHVPTFGPFSEPRIWSHFGKDGRDGDGLEYVFWGVNIAQSEIIDTMIQNATNHEIFPDQKSNFTGTVNNKHYQDSDFLPTLTITGNTVLQSVDNNPGITSVHPCIYASKRKFHDSGNGGSWGDFGPITLWNVQGPQGPQGPAGTNGVNGNVYTVVPTFTSLVASNPTTNNGTTTYSITGSAGWHLYENGVAQSNAYCEAYLGSTQLTVSHSNGSNDFSVTIPNNTSSSTLFVQILWYNDSSKTNFYDGTIIPVSIKGADGQNGQDASSQSIEGPVMRLRQWTNNTDYYNGTLAASDGITYLDVIWVNEGTPQSPEINYYKCVNDHTSASSGNFSVGNNWELYTMMSDSVFNTILARSAYITNLTAKQVVITDNNVVVAGMASGTAINAASGVGTNGTVSETVDDTVESVRIWAGTPATSGNLLTTPFRVMDNGHLYATNATVSGNVTANKITTTGGGIIQIVFGSAASVSEFDANKLYFLY